MPSSSRRCAFRPELLMEARCGHVTPSSEHGLAHVVTTSSQQQDQPGRKNVPSALCPSDDLNQVPDRCDHPRTKLLRSNTLVARAPPGADAAHDGPDTRAVIAFEPRRVSHCPPVPDARAASHLARPPGDRRHGGDDAGDGVPSRPRLRAGRVRERDWRPRAGRTVNRFAHRAPGNGQEIRA